MCLIASNYLCSIHIELSINLEIIQSIFEDVHKLYENTMPFFLRFEYCTDFIIPGGPGIHTNGKIHVSKIKLPLVRDY